MLIFSMNAQQSKKNKHSEERAMKFTTKTLSLGTEKSFFFLISICCYKIREKEKVFLCVMQKPVIILKSVKYLVASRTHFVGQELKG